MYGIFDIIVLVCIAFFAFSGLKNGLIEEVIKLIGFILAIYIAVKYYYLGIVVLQHFLNITSDGVATVSGFIVVFMIIYLSLLLLSWTLQSIIKSLKLVWLDRSFGLLFGAFKGILIMSIFVWLISVFKEFGYAERLKESSITYNMLHSFKNTISEFFNIDDDISVISDSIREIFMLNNGS